MENRCTHKSAEVQRCSNDGQASGDIPDYSSPGLATPCFAYPAVAACLVIVVAMNRRQLQHHAGGSKQRTSLVGEQIQLSFGILGKSEHSQP
jgi:hypothetical protein